MMTKPAKPSALPGRSWQSLFSLIVLCLFSGAYSSQNDEFIVAAYLPDYRFSSVNLNASAPYLTDLILFSIQPHVRGFVNGCCLDESHYQAVSEAPFRTWVSVGGGGRSAAFRELLADSKLRARLIKNLLKLCDKYSLNGVDFDWEIPQTQDDILNYVTLLREAHESFQKHNLLLSVTVHPRQFFLSAEIYDFLDRVNLMSYDMPGPYHADMETVKQEVELFLDHHCPPSKLVMGVPAYGRHESNPSMVRTFSELMDDSQSKAALSNTWNGYRYDSPDDMRAKVEYAKEKGLAGVFLWELGQDKKDLEQAPGGILLEAIAAAVADNDSSARDGSETEL